MSIQRRIIETIAGAAVILTAVAVVVPVSLAASITSVSDKPTTLQAGQAANQTLVFTTPTGVAEGSTVTLSFSTSFDTSSITEDDVDIADDGADLTTAATCAGSEQASVAIASDVVTFTICAGDGGAIAAGSVVSMEIGTNATASGTGANRITNPSSVGTYFVTVAGTFGDDGSIALPISGDDSIAVSAEVPSSGGGSGVGGGGDSSPSSDTTAPAISNLIVSGVTATSATVTWSTNESATSAIDYGLTTAFELGMVSSTSLVTSHSVPLTGLSAGQTYYLRARSSDASSNQATSSTQSFATLDTAAPVISNISVVDVTASSARVTWTTDEAATSTVAYGLTTAYGSSHASTTLVTSHSVLLTGLSAATTYHFQVLSADASSNQAFSSDQTFATLANLPPANVSSLNVATGDTANALTWTNPLDADLSGVRVLSCTNAFPDSPTDADCAILTNALATSYTHSGLTNGATYYYGVFAFDTAGQFASGALGSGTPSAAEVEVPGEEVDEVDEVDEGEGEEVDEGEEVEEESPGGEESEESGDAETGETISGETVSEETPTSLSAEEGAFTAADITYSVAGETIDLSPSATGIVNVLPSAAITVSVPSSVLGADIESVYLIVGGETYLMSLDGETGLYEASVLVPSLSGVIDLTVTVVGADASETNVSSYLRVVAPGYVYQIIDEEEAGIASAVVTLYAHVGNQWIVWDASPFSQFNPTQTSVDGTFAWYVPNGTYYVAVQAAGFEGTQSNVLAAEDGIVHPRIRMVAIEEEVEKVEEVDKVEKVEEGNTVSAFIPETVAAAIVESIAAPIAVASETLQTIREIPAVETTAQVSTPVLAVTAGASVVVMAVAFDFLPFLQYFFTAPVLFFWRRKRKSYGVIYNAISKTPVDLATVRLFQVTEEDLALGRPGRLVKSRVTDRGGRYFFLVTPGKYRVVAMKTGFQFPTEYMKGEKTDGQYLDVYHGEPITVGGSGVVITANIPLDPSQAEKFRAPASIMLRARLRTFQHVVSAVGVIAAIVFAALRPTVFSIAMVGIQVVMLLLVKRLARPHQPINWGIVYDKTTGRPIARAIARIFEPKYNKVLETQVTDSKGRYAFLLGPNEYFATFEKEGYVGREIRPIDFTKSQEPKDFSEKVPLEAVPPR